jgi:hypothetical protein
MLGACIARADVYYDFETPDTSPVWIGTTQMIQNTSASYDGTDAIAFLPVVGGVVMTELPPCTTNVEFYIYDDYGPNPPLYEYMFLRLLETTNSAAVAGFSMLDGGWGTTPPMTENHYYAWTDYDWYSGPYSATNMGPIRTVGWHKFNFAIGSGSIAMSVDDSLVFQTNIIQVPQYLAVSFGQDGGWGRMDDLYISTAKYDATATATLANDFVVAANITDGGHGYTNTPLVRFIGGGGSGAQAVAVVSNGLVIAVNVLDAGYGYTNAPLVVIEPPFIPSPVLSIAPMSFLAFSNLTVGGNYQLQQSVAWYWSNQPVTFTATNALYTQMFAGVVGSGDYRLALNPVPAQAFATPQLVNGFVVGATVTAGGSGYFTTPAVNINGDVGSNATAVASINGGAVTGITITSAGIGYTNMVTVQIDPPPAASLSPTVQPVMRLDSASLTPYDNYQIQFKPDIGGAWANWNGGLFSPTDVTNSQYIFITNGIGFFRLQYVP